MLALCSTPLRRIDRAIGRDQSRFAFFALDRIPVFHPDHEILAFFRRTVVNVFENVGVIDFTGAGLFAARVVSCLKISNFAPGLIDVWNQIPFANLLMIDIEKDLAGRTVDRPADSVGLV